MKVSEPQRKARNPTVACHDVMPYPTSVTGITFGEGILQADDALHIVVICLF